MRPDEARVGTKVQVREGCEKADLRGRVGVVAKTYGAHGRAALHVRFDDGLWQLLWPRDVEREEAQRNGAGAYHRPTGS